MSSFFARTRARSVVLARREDIWALLIDPVLMARFTPFVRNITADGDHWFWEMSGLSVLGLKVAPSFTERMELREPERIEFRHDPPAGRVEKAGAQGWYALTPTEDGTELTTELEITVDLPLPRASGPAVRATMRKVIDAMGDRFSQNLLEHLGAEERSA
ncbi:MAG TPA: SRPBCC family protein [Nocardioides sp.]|uniref:SRPBCC family protein n=1 Tax=Nocardioides sp. TaxID=35761 RepID=UPI002E362042|nr:SRPBCC family protein [Nocardioides sp.]HEX5088914.1 SRPBCC family protein [Nocardioides sp.]